MTKYKVSFEIELNNPEDKTELTSKLFYTCQKVLDKFNTSIIEELPEDKPALCCRDCNESESYAGAPFCSITKKLIPSLDKLAANCPKKKEASGE